MSVEQIPEDLSFITVTNSPERQAGFKGHSEEKVETSMVGMGLRVVELGALSTLTSLPISIDLQRSIWVPERPQRTG